LEGITVTANENGIGTLSLDSSNWIGIRSFEVCIRNQDPLETFTWSESFPSETYFFDDNCAKVKVTKSPKIDIAVWREGSKLQFRAIGNDPVRTEAINYGTSSGCSFVVQAKKGGKWKTIARSKKLTQTSSGSSFNYVKGYVNAKKKTAIRAYYADCKYRKYTYSTKTKQKRMWVCDYGWSRSTCSWEWVSIPTYSSKSRLIKLKSITSSVVTK
jgi:hypothetical protein